MKKILFTLLIIQSTWVCAQDYHLSNYDLSVQYLNPGLTGVLNEDDVNYRINANYRGQWSKLNGSPYRTISLGYDMPYNRFGLGIYMINNHAGNNNLNTNNIMLSGSYQVMNNTAEHSLTAGVQMGLLNKNLSPDTYLFDKQYSPAAGGMDASLSNGESFASDHLWKFDASVGVYYKLTNKSKKINPFGGFSIYHVTRPNESFVTLSKLPMRFTVHGGSDIRIDEKLDLTPGFLLMQQSMASELNLNLMASYKIKDTDYKVLGGLGWRNSDAIIVLLGIKQKASTFRISYDINTSSPMKTYTHGKGAFEIGVIYMGNNKKLPGSRTRI